MEFQDWLQLGINNGWLTRLPEHGPHTVSAEPELEEWCSAHNEGQACCGDHSQVYRVGMKEMA